MGIRKLSFQKVELDTFTLQIGTRCFEGCENLETIAFVGDGTIPIISVGTSTFNNCTKLSDFEGASVDSITFINSSNNVF
jgi:hypothetical protein